MINIKIETGQMANPADGIMIYLINRDNYLTNTLFVKLLKLIYISVLYVGQGEFSTLLCTTCPDANTYSDANLILGKKYFYRIYAYIDIVKTFL